MKTSDNVKELFAGMVKVRAKIKQPAKTAKNPFLKNNYVPLEGVQKAVDDAKEGTGIDYGQLVETGPNGMTGVSTIVYATNGEFLITDPLYLRPVKNDPQGNGSSITYARRYQLCALFGISSDADDDASEASGYHNNRRQPPQQRRGQQPNYPQQNNYNRNQQNNNQPYNGGYR